MISEISTYRDRLLQSITLTIRDWSQGTARDHPLSWYGSPHSVPLSFVCHYTRLTAVALYAAWLSSFYALEVTLCVFRDFLERHKGSRCHTLEDSLSRQVCTAPACLHVCSRNCKKSDAFWCLCCRLKDVSFTLCLKCRCPHNWISETFSRFCCRLYALQLFGDGERRGIGGTFIVVGEDGAVMG